MGVTHPNILKSLCPLVALLTISYNLVIIFAFLLLSSLFAFLLLSSLFSFGKQKLCLAFVSLSP